MAMVWHMFGRIGPVQWGVFMGVLGTASTITTVALVGSGWEAGAVGFTTERALPALLLLVMALAGIAATAVPWLLVSDPPATGAWLAAAAVAGQAPLWSGWDELAAPIRAVVLATTLLVPGCVAASVVRRGAAVTVSLAAGATAMLLHAAAYDPFHDLDCHRLRTCAAADVILSGRAAEFALDLATGLGLLAVAAALLAMLRRRTLVLSPVTGCVAITLAGVVVVTGRVPVEVAGHVVASDLLLALAVAGLALTVGTDQLRIRRTRQAVDGLIEQLERTQEIIEVPGTEILTPAQRLALDNAVLMARSRAALMETRALQRRTRQRADDERERIERDLHDGAQQQLVSAAMQLGLASSTGTDGLAHAVEAARGEVLTALEALRVIAHGPFPRTLTEEGLLAALDELCADHGARLDVSPFTESGDVQVDRAAYAAVEALIADERITNEVLLRRTVRNLQIEVDRAATLPLDVQDRVRSVGGDVMVGGGRTTVVLPCGS
jgi:signal transduction histidine kinase